MDTGYGLPEVFEHWDRLLRGLDGPVTRILVTHGHPDHVGLAAWLQARTGAPLAMTLGEFYGAQHLRKRTLTPSAADILDALFGRALDSHPMIFAMGEAIAHLNHLEQRGRLEGTQGPDGILRFRTPSVPAPARITLEP